MHQSELISFYSNQSYRMTTQDHDILTYSTISYLFLHKILCFSPSTMLHHISFLNLQNIEISWKLPIFKFFVQNDLFI
ncbi:hypothetical protein KUTeg_010250 [Tegillarca granosa]|uniref:Uncharacterized protein n=1 Tax=Tegillarca granosa TaxID=220873 RepID=A0ABQ9F684_TEGGR|nr:hypothetical protein KUTeg_010250 [Tegillarca granosa]